jgi:hypothetical protein
MKVIFRVIEFERRKSALGHKRTLTPVNLDNLEGFSVSHDKAIYLSNVGFCRIFCIFVVKLKFNI